MNKEQLLSLVKQKAAKYGLDYSLVAAVVEQESGWNTWAIRYEPGFYEHYVKGMTLSETEKHARSTSWGLMQVMGQVAREHGFKGLFLSELCDPEVGLDCGCAHLFSWLQRVGGNTETALLRYNGGANPNYPGEVMARIPDYS